ncbi:hypothetical protein ACIA49_38520 [Kribbella sp. NPDC051587]|uniref:hypothetical protein n=1 Tax=Kribbella sp. NPDC051587 TaxID=3364119 RepID=UPI0037BB7846
MTQNKRRKAAIRARQAETGSPYLVARRQLSERPAVEVEVLPPLTAWTKPHDCSWWAKTAAEHGPLMAVKISSGARWWELDDVAREVAGALQDRPTEERGLWIAYDRYAVTKREHLPGIAAALAAVDALPRLIVRAAPDAAHCEHASCRRRRGEPPLPRATTSRTPARPTTVLGPVRSLAQVMEQHPSLGYYGFGSSRHADQTPAERRAALASDRTQLAGHDSSVQEIAGWLRDNVPPIKTPTARSYDMKHIVENMIGRYVSNGELIAAALSAGYTYRHIDGPNATLGMATRAVDELRKASRAR